MENIFLREESAAANCSWQKSFLVGGADSRLFSVSEKNRL
jgi:hypothetical protein